VRVRRSRRAPAGFSLRTTLLRACVVYSPYFFAGNPSPGTKSNLPVDSWKIKHSDPSTVPLVCFILLGVNKYEPGPSSLRTPPSGMIQNLPEIAISLTSLEWLCGGLDMPAGNLMNAPYAPFVTSPQRFEYMLPGGPPFISVHLMSPAG